MTELLHAYRNESDIRVAHSEDDALEQMLEEMGEFRDFADAIGPFTQLPDDQLLELFSEDDQDGWEPVERVLGNRTYHHFRLEQTCAEWAKGGRGLIAGGEE